MSCVFTAPLDSPTLTSSWVLFRRFIPYGMRREGEMKVLLLLLLVVVFSILGFHS